MRRLFILTGILIALIISWFIFNQKEKAVTEDYFISTQGQSNDRVKKLSLDKASENASNILDLSKLSFPKTEEKRENIDYKPDEETDFVINIKALSPVPFKKDDLWKLFDKEFRINFGAAQIYGYAPIEKRWTFVIAGGNPEIYDTIQIAIDLLEICDGQNSVNATKALERYISEINKKVKSFPTKVEPEITEKIEHAVSRGMKLAELKTEFDIEAVILLKSDKMYDGKLAWDVLQSVGLVWGDGDLFHWDNKENYGGDQHFSVWTTTHPGYFLPEDIKDGSMNPVDLGFSFSVPRSADPKNVFAVMLDAVKYCQSRLGGTILDKDGNLFNEIKEKQYLDDVVEKMKRKGLTAGSYQALRMF